MIRTIAFRDIGRTGAFAVVAGLLIVSCGGGGGGAAAKPTTGAESPSAASDVLSVVGTEYAFAPTALKAPAGPTTIRFTNRGVMEHDFMIDALHVHISAQPGKSAEANVTLTPGTYKSTCSVPGHNESGMHGTLTVT